MSRPKLFVKPIKAKPATMSTMPPISCLRCDHFAVTMMATGASKALTSAYAVIRRLIAESETPVSEAIWSGTPNRYC